RSRKILDRMVARGRGQAISRTVARRSAAAVVGDDSILRRRRGLQARDFENLLGVEGFARDQGRRERVELFSMDDEEPPRLLVALDDDAAHLGVDRLGGGLAVRLLPAVAVEAAEVRILSGRELHETDPVAHA